MDNELLKQFYQQEHLRVAVYQFFKQVLDEIALERVYRGQETAGIKDAKEVLVRAESALQSKFAPKKAKPDKRRAE